MATATIHPSTPTTGTCEYAWCEFSPVFDGEARAGYLDGTNSVQVDVSSAWALTVQWVICVDCAAARGICPDREHIDNPNYLADSRRVPEWCDCSCNMCATGAARGTYYHCGGNAECTGRRREVSAADFEPMTTEQLMEHGRSLHAEVLGAVFGTGAKPATKPKMRRRRRRRRSATTLASVCGQCGATSDALTPSSVEGHPIRLCAQCVKEGA